MWEAFDPYTTINVCCVVENILLLKERFGAKILFCAYKLRWSWNFKWKSTVTTIIKISSHDYKFDIEFPKIGKMQFLEDKIVLFSNGLCAWRNLNRKDKVILIDSKWFTKKLGEWGQPTILGHFHSFGNYILLRIQRENGMVLRVKPRLQSSNNGNKH